MNLIEQLMNESRSLNKTQKSKKRRVNESYKPSVEEIADKIKEIDDSGLASDFHDYLDYVDYFNRTYSWGITRDDVDAADDYLWNSGYYDKTESRKLAQNENKKNLRRVNEDYHAVNNKESQKIYNFILNNLPEDIVVVDKNYVNAKSHLDNINPKAPSPGPNAWIIVDNNGEEENIDIFGYTEDGRWGFGYDVPGFDKPSIEYDGRSDEIDKVCQQAIQGFDWDYNNINSGFESTKIESKKSSKKRVNEDFEYDETSEEDRGTYDWISTRVADDIFYKFWEGFNDSEEQDFMEAIALLVKVYKSMRSRSSNEGVSRKKVKEDVSVNGVNISSIEELCKFIGCDYDRSWGAGLLHKDSISEVVDLFHSLGMTDHDYYVANADDIDHGEGDPDAPIQATIDDDYGYFLVEFYPELASGWNPNK